MKDVWAHTYQIRNRIEEKKDVNMEEEMWEEENFTESDIDESMQSEEEDNPQPEDSSGDEIGSRSLLRFPPLVVRRSRMSTGGVKLYFQEV